MNSGRRNTRIAKWAGVALLLWFLVGSILFPALKTLELSLTDSGVLSLCHYTQFFSLQTSLTPLINSVILGALTVLVCGTIGTALAFCVNFFEFPCKYLIDKLLLLPMMLPGIIIVFAFVQLYGESGLVTKTLEMLPWIDNVPYRFSGLPGILFVHAYTQYVYFYISVSIAIKHIDCSVIESARNLGASKRQVLISVILPFLTPALIASSVLTFMSGIGSFTAPSIIGGGFRVLTTQILLSKANNYMEVAATQVVVLTCISLVLFLVFRIYEGKSGFSSSVKGIPIQPVRIRNRVVRALMLTVAVMLILTILLPILTIMVLSFVPSGSWMVDIYPKEFSWQNYLDIFTRSRKFAPFANSIVMSLFASFLGLIVAVPASYLLIKTRSRVRWLVELLVMLPWAMPCSAIAINIINAFNEPSVFSLNTVLVGTTILLPLGYFVRSIPLMVKTTNISFQNLNDTYLEASQSLGATGIQTFRRIVVPVISPGLMAGFLLMFIRSIGEYTVSVFLYNASNRPISIAMVNGIFEYNIGLAMAYGTLLIVLTAALSTLIAGFFSRS